jgi:hypothetical protein
MHGALEFGNGNGRNGKREAMELKLEDREEREQAGGMDGGLLRCLLWTHHSWAVAGLVVGGIHLWVQFFSSRTEIVVHYCMYICII